VKLLNEKQKIILKNGMEYVGITETPYQNLMLDRGIMIIEKKTCMTHVFTTRGGKA
jgi:hypothetical protein